MKGPVETRLVPPYVEPGGGSGVTAHGDLTGLLVDDHTQYLNTTRANTWFAGKDSDDLAEGVVNLYLTVSERGEISSNSTHRTTASGNPHNVTPADLSLVIGTDVQAWNVKLDTFAGLADGTSGQVLSTSGAGVYSWVTIPTAPVDSVDGRTGVVTLNDLYADIAHDHDADYQPLEADLTALSALTTTGIAVRTAADTWATRSLASGSGIVLDRADGTTGDPNIALADQAGRTVMGVSGATAGPPTAISLGTNTILGRALGDIFPITMTAAGRALIDDADASAQRTTLGLAIGSDVQAWDSKLDTFAALADGSSGQVLSTNGLGVYSWVDNPAAPVDSVDGRTGVVTLSDLYASTAHNHDADYQPLDAGLTSISGLTTAANKMIYTTALDTYAVADLTAAGRALLDDASASAQRTTLGLGAGDAPTFTELHLLDGSDELDLYVSGASGPFTIASLTNAVHLFSETGALTLGSGGVEFGTSVEATGTGAGYVLRSHFTAVTNPGVTQYWLRMDGDAGEVAGLRGAAAGGCQLRTVNSKLFLVAAGANDVGIWTNSTERLLIDGSGSITALADTGEHVLIGHDGDTVGLPAAQAGEPLSAATDTNIDVTAGVVLAPTLLSGGAHSTDDGGLTYASGVITFEKDGIIQLGGTFSGALAGGGTGPSLIGVDVEFDTGVGFSLATGGRMYIMCERSAYATTCAWTHIHSVSAGDKVRFTADRLQGSDSVNVIRQRISARYIRMDG